eukprot:Pgem_evm2s4892
MGSKNKIIEDCPLLVPIEGSEDAALDNAPSEDTDNFIDGIESLTSKCDDTGIHPCAAEWIIDSSINTDGQIEVHELISHLKLQSTARFVCPISFYMYE